MAFFQRVLGFRLDEIYPADDPSPVTLCVLADDPAALAKGETRLMSPAGNRIEIAAIEPDYDTPTPTQEYIVRRLVDRAPWVRMCDAMMLPPNRPGIRSR